MGRKRRRSFEAMEKDAQAADLYRQGQSFREISRSMGWRSPASAVAAVKRAAMDAASDPQAAAEALALMLERIQDRRRLLYEVIKAPHYAVSATGKVAMIIDSEGIERPLTDNAPLVRAIAELRHEDEHEAKLLGVYAPVKARVEVITEEVVSAETQRIVATLVAAGEMTEAEGVVYALPAGRSTA